MAETITLIADLFPGSVVLTETGKRPEGVPTSAKLKVVVATHEIAIGWELGSFDGIARIGELRLDISAEDTSGLDHNGGIVGLYRVERAGGCSCGKGLKRWNPYAGQQVTQLVRAGSSRTGLPQQYTR